MTEGEFVKERDEATRKAEAALARAVSVRERSARIGQGWAQSRRDNNFRLMLRNLGKGVPDAS